MEKLKKADKIAKKEFNPREHRLLHGVRNQDEIFFQGMGKKLKAFKKK